MRRHHRLIAEALLLLLCSPSAGSAVAVSSSAAAKTEISSPTLSLQVIWPRAGARFPFVERSFTFGNVTPGSTLTVNGQPLTIQEDGAFIAMIPFSSGTTVLEYDAFLGRLSTSVLREVTVASPLETTSTEAEGFDDILYEPWADIELSPGDTLAVQVKGPPGLKGTFRIKRISKRLPLVEKPGRIRGIYQGHYRIQPDDRGEGRKIEFRLRHPETRRKYKGKAPGRLTIRDPRQFRIAVTSYPITIVKSDAWKGWSFFLPSGVKLITTGKYLNQVKIRLDRGREGWVDEGRISYLPAGTPPPKAQIGRYFFVESTTDSAKLRFAVSEKVPFEIKHTIEPFTLELWFYNAVHRVDRFRFSPEDPVIKDILWRQEGESVFKLTVQTNLTWGWGYHGDYDDKGNFVLEIRRPPDLTHKRGVLRGRKIVIDPGHSPEPSAIGPLGSEEQHTNLAIGLKLRTLLETMGAEVYMTRSSTAPLALMDRPFLAWGSRGEIFVSIHGNAVPVTADPLENPMGYMNFYYHSQSRPLAESVHKSYRKNWKQLHDSGLRWGDLHVCRLSEMPAILTETAYLILPEQERILRSEKGQSRFAKTILEGIQDYLRRYRKIQRASPAERRAAKE